MRVSQAIYQEWIVWPTVRRDLLSSIKEPGDHLKIHQCTWGWHRAYCKKISLSLSHSVCVPVCAIVSILWRMSVVLVIQGVSRDMQNI